MQGGSQSRVWEQKKLTKRRYVKWLDWGGQFPAREGPPQSVSAARSQTLWPHTSTGQPAVPWVLIESTQPDWVGG